MKKVKDGIKTEEQNIEISAIFNLSAAEGQV